MDLSIAVMSKPGGRAHNEDACGYWSADMACCCVVSDGLGGYLGGQVASKLVVSTVLKQFSGKPDNSQQFLADLLGNANQALIQEKQQNPALAEMRATAVILALDFSRGVSNWAHLGDTRLYCFRQCSVLSQTLDHSYLQNMVNLGHLEHSQIRSHPMRNLLLGALGSEEEFTPSIHCQPIPVQAGDAFLLCTDGFWQYVEEREMLETLAQAQSADNWLGIMEELLLTRAAEGNDNYSAIAVWLGSPRTMSETTAEKPEKPSETVRIEDGQSGAGDWASGTLPLR